MSASATETGNVVDVGDRYEFRAEFRDKTLALSDPATVTLRVEKPDGTIVGPWTWPAEVTRESLGLFFREHTLDAAGIWTAEWITTGAPTTALYERVVAQESLLTGEPDVVLSSRALVSLEAALGYCGIDADQIGLYDEVTRAINSVSRAAHKTASREFKPTNPASHARSFQIPVRGYMATRVPRELRVGDLASPPTEVSIAKPLGSSTTLTAEQLALVVSLPRVRQEWQPIRRLRLWEAATYDQGDVVTVTGTWGFPAVPDDVVTACLMQIQYWMNRDHSKWSETFAQNETAANTENDPGRFLLKSVWECFAGYRDVGISWGVS